MKIKRILIRVSAAAVVIAIVFIALWASHQPKNAPCARLEVEIIDSLDRRFVESKELRQLLYREGLLPVGKQMNEVSCHAIEECLKNHEMVRTAECYKSQCGSVCVRVTQRVPALYVIGGEGNYYVDTDRKIMPVRKSIDVVVPKFKGVVGKRAATEEYYDFAQWLVDNRYWNERIAHVKVHHPKHLVLAQKDGKGDIILGNLMDYEQKLQKLQKLYTDGFDQIGYKPYREYDLRFDGQVVGRY